MKKVLKYIIAILIVAIPIIGLLYIKTKNKLSLNFDLDIAREKKNIIPIAVIGSGPAGLSAALYGARSAIYTVVFEGPKPGGQLTDTTYVENWPGTKKLLGSELINQNKSQAEQFGAIMASDTIECVDFSQWPFRLQTSEGHEVHALSVIIATGANPKHLQVPGETGYWLHGISACATCDAPFFKDKKIVVVGGGDSAIEEATLLASYAQHVTLMARGDLRAAPAMKKRLKNYNNIQVMLDTSITQFIGNKNSLTDIEIINNKDKSKRKMPIDGVFLAIGHIPNSQIFKDFLKLDDLGYIKLIKQQETSIPGIFAAGDVSDPLYKQAGTSAGDGIKAGMDAINFLQGIGYGDNYFETIQDSVYDPDEDKQIDIKKITTNKEFDDLLKKNKPLIIEVGSPQCPSCKTLINALKSTAAKLEGKANFAQIDLADDPKELKERFNIQSVPMLLIFKESKLFLKENRALPKHELYNIINGLI